MIRFGGKSLIRCPLGFIWNSSSYLSVYQGKKDKKKLNLNWEGSMGFAIFQLPEGPYCIHLMLIFIWYVE